MTSTSKVASLPRRLSINAVAEFGPLAGRGGARGTFGRMGLSSLSSDSGKPTWGGWTAAGPGADSRGWAATGFEAGGAGLGGGGTWDHAGLPNPVVIARMARTDLGPGLRGRSP